MLPLPGSGQGWPRSPHGCHRRCPRTCRAAVPRSIPAGAGSRCQGEGKGGDTPERKAAPAPPQNPALRLGGLEVSGARCCTPGDWGGCGRVVGVPPNRQPNSPRGDSTSPPAAPCWHSRSWGAAGCPPAVG